MIKFVLPDDYPDKEVSERILNAFAPCIELAGEATGWPDLNRLIRGELTEEEEAKERKAKERLNKIDEYRKERCPTCGRPPVSMHRCCWIYRFRGVMPENDNEFLIGCSNPNCSDYNNNNIVYCNDVLEGYRQWSEARKGEHNL